MLFDDTSSPDDARHGIGHENYSIVFRENLERAFAAHAVNGAKFCALIIRDDAPSFV